MGRALDWNQARRGEEGGYIAATGAKEHDDELFRLFDGARKVLMLLKLASWWSGGKNNVTGYNYVHGSAFKTGRAVWEA